MKIQTQAQAKQILQDGMQQIKVAYSTGLNAVKHLANKGRAVIESRVAKSLGQSAEDILGKM
ncbi:hypothetical protein HZC21_02125 [Candidatus Peregrinibacteria bacterium]|nr:hypothetical protein [Candidatus Peregrinibacteria bacterium]